MVDVFPPEQQTQIRVQQPCSGRRQNPAEGQFGRVMAQEILINTPATANLIREGENSDRACRPWRKPRPTLCSMGWDGQSQQTGQRLIGEI